MVGNDLFTYAYNNRDAAPPYSGDFFKEVQKLSPDKLEFLAQEIAPYYFNGSSNDMSYVKIMTHMAKSLNQNKNPISIAEQGIKDYATAVRMPLPDFLPDLSPQQPVTPQPVVPQQVADVTPTITALDINLLRGLFTSKEFNLRPHFGMYYNEHLSVDKLPPQGYKFHISVDSAQDFNKVARDIVPTLNKMGIMFKVADPETYFNNKRQVQQGKGITVYPSKMFSIMFTDKAFDDNYINKHFSKAEAKLIKENRKDFQKITDILFGAECNPAFAPSSDVLVGGRVFARYGREKQQMININNIPDFQKDYVSVALQNAGLISGPHEFNQFELQNKNLVDKDGNLKISIISAPDGTFSVDRQSGVALPPFLMDKNIQPADMLFEPLIREEQFQNGEISEEQYIQSTYLGIPPQSGQTAGYVYYEYGAMPQGSSILANFMKEKQLEKVKDCKAEIDRAIYYQAKVKTDFTNNTTHFQHNGKCYCAIPYDTAVVLNQYLSQYPNKNIKQVEFSSETHNTDNHNIDTQNLDTEER